MDQNYFPLLTFLCLVKVIYASLQDRFSPDFVGVYQKFPYLRKVTVVAFRTAGRTFLEASKAVEAILPYCY